MDFEAFFYIESRKFIKQSCHHYKMALNDELQNYVRGSTARLNERFFAGDSVDIARDLLGRYLVRKFDNGRYVVGQIREVAAFQGETIQSAEGMLNEAGIISVNNRYGNLLFDISTGRQDQASCVNFRAAAFYFDEVTEANGPGNLTKGLGIDMSFNDVLLERSDSLWIEGNEMLVGEKYRTSMDVVTPNFKGSYSIRD